MKLWSFLLGAALAAGGATCALAAESSTSVSASSTSASSSSDSASSDSLRMKLKKFNKKHEVNTDITNAEMAAQAGSRSQYSVKFNVSYYGAPIERPFSKEGPNPDNSPIDPSTALSGSLSLRYRLNKKSAVSLGSGLTALTPFHGVKRVDTKNPYVSIDYNYKAGEFQLRNSASISATTVENYTKRGQNASVSLSQGLAYNVPDTKFTMGASASLSLYNYTREYQPKDGSVSRYYLGVYPFAEYGFAQKYSLKTSFGFGFYNPRSSSDEWEMQRRLVSQWLGVGYSHSRTVYIYPYLSFYPSKFHWGTTTVAFSTVFSVL